MATYTARLDFGAVLEPPDRCPGCGQVGLEAMLGSDTPVFHCTACGGCWRFVLGRFFIVDTECERP